MDKNDHDHHEKEFVSEREVDGVRVKSEAIPVRLGRRPPKDALHAHAHNTNGSGGKAKKVRGSF